MKLALPAVLVGCAVGLTAGFLIGRAGSFRDTGAQGESRPTSGDAVPISRENEPDANPRITGLEEELKRAEADLAAARAAGAPGLNELRKQAGPLYEKKDGHGLLRLMAAFYALGEVGFPDAIAILHHLLTDDDNYDYNLDSEEPEEALYYWMPALARWALANPALAPSRCRRAAAGSLGVNRDDRDPKEMMRLLMAEKDEDVARSLAGNIDATEEMIPDLEAALRAHTEGRYTVNILVYHIAWLRTPASFSLLQKLASDPSPIVREEAEVQIQRQDPLATGIFLDTDSKTLAEAGVHRGDILVAIGDTPITSSEVWEQQRNTVGKSDEVVTFTVNRAGTTISFRMKGRDVWEMRSSDFVVRRK